MRSLVTIGLLSVLAGCGQPSAGPARAVAGPGVDASDDSSAVGTSDSCFTICPLSQPAALYLSCPSVVASAQSTGGCTVSGCAPKTPGTPCAQDQLLVQPTQVGPCHVDVTLEGGFEYALDVTFVQTTSGTLCPCTLIVPTHSEYAIPNPSTTCASDAGVDSGADAASDTGVDVDAAFEAEVTESATSG